MIYLKMTSKPAVLPRVPDPSSPKRKFASSAKLPECPQLKILRIDGSLYFGAAFYVEELFRRIREHYPLQKHLLVCAQGVHHIDVSGAELLEKEAEIRRASDGEIYFYKLQDSARGVLNKGGYLKLLNPDHMYSSKGVAIASIFEKLDKDICRTCVKRIFNECKTIPQNTK
jgi:SulP family sulfate permease